MNRRKLLKGGLASIGLLLCPWKLLAASKKPDILDQWASSGCFIIIDIGHIDKDCYVIKDENDNRKTVVPLSYYNNTEKNWYCKHMLKCKLPYNYILRSHKNKMGFISSTRPLQKVEGQYKGKQIVLEFRRIAHCAASLKHNHSSIDVINCLNIKKLA